jgi:hypothetical protein
MEEKDVVRMEAGPGSSHKHREKYKIIRTAKDSGSIISIRVSYYT